MRDWEDLPLAIRQQVYIYDGSLRRTSSRAVPDRLVSITGSTAGPLVSCLMVTRGDPARVRAAIACFRRQTYRDKELVVVSSAAGVELQRLVETSGSDIRLIQAEKGLSLGLLRKISVERSEGEIVCVWDDDDLYGAHRLERGVGALVQARADAVFLRQVCIWSPGRKILRLSHSRSWEATMLAFKTALPRYPDAPRNEDTVLVEAMLGQRSIALMDDPLSYCYCVHGQNTSDAAQLQAIIDAGSLKFDYGRALAALSASFAFAEHAAAEKSDRLLLARHAGQGGPLKRLEAYLAVNQFLRRLRYRRKRRYTVSSKSESTSC